MKKTLFFLVSLCALSMFSSFLIAGDTHWLLHPKVKPNINVNNSRTVSEAALQSETLLPNTALPEKVRKSMAERAANLLTPVVKELTLCTSSHASESNHQISFSEGNNPPIFASDSVDPKESFIIQALKGERLITLVGTSTNATITSDGFTRIKSTSSNPNNITYHLDSDQVGNMLNTSGDFPIYFSPFYDNCRYVYSNFRTILSMADHLILKVGVLWENYILNDDIYYFFYGNFDHYYHNAVADVTVCSQRNSDGRTIEIGFDPDGDSHFIYADEGTTYTPDVVVIVALEDNTDVVLSIPSSRGLISVSKPVMAFSSYSPNRWILFNSASVWNTGGKEGLGIGYSPANNPCSIGSGATQFTLNEGEHLVMHVVEAQ